jgi:ABC-type glycerol-3-phosphate transport system substrate-binding protein
VRAAIPWRARNHARNRGGELEGELRQIDYVRGAIAIALCGLAGCTSDNTLTFAAALLPGELSVYRAVVDDFERREGIKVDIVAQQYADIRRALAAEAIAGSGSLDLVELDVYSLPLAVQDVAVLRDDEVGDPLDELSAAAVRAGRLDGLRFLPHRLSWQALIYNHAVLGKPPETWEEVLAVARAHPQQIGFKAALYEGLTCDVLPFVWSAGGSGESFADAGAHEAFRFFAQLAPYLHAQSATFKESTIAEAMARGELLLHLNWPFVMSLYASQGLAPGTIRSAPLPHAPSGAAPATVLGGGYLAIPRKAPQRQKALRLTRFLLSRTTQLRFNRELGWFSPRVDIADDNGSPLLSGFEAMRDRIESRPERADYPHLSRLWQRAFRAVVFEHADPGEALRKAQRDLQG